MVRIRWFWAGVSLLRVLLQSLLQFCTVLFCDDYIAAVVLGCLVRLPRGEFEGTSETTTTSASYEPLAQLTG